MNTTQRLVVTISLTLGLVAGGLAALAVTATANTGSMTQAAAATTSADEARRVFRPRKRFAREFVRRGDRDTSTRHIEHVRELQIRLRRAGVWHGSATGTFGKRTYRAVKRFQRRHDLAVTGRANVRTWRKLIPRTVQGRHAIPPRCKRQHGWHLCYDRKRHQVTLWKRGTLWNSWLVRGGSASTPTRKGRFRVYYRDKDHVSSLYGSPMPYSQFFSGGQAFHGSTLMMNPFAGHSHGCVNMYIEDARQLWKLTASHRLEVRVYGPWD